MAEHNLGSIEENGKLTRVKIDRIEFVLRQLLDVIGGGTYDEY